jgi:hypothetical protein
VISVYVHLMVCASNATERGRTEGWCSEDVATALDLDTAEVEGILGTMQGRVIDGEVLTGWRKRQPAREDGAADRAKSWRDKKKEEAERKRTQANASGADANTANGANGVDLDVDTDKEDKTIVPIPFHDIIAAYNKFCPSLPRADDLNIPSTRHMLIKSAWLRYSKHEGGPLKILDTLFRKAEASEFLTGKIPGHDGKVFKAKFDWLLDESKMSNVIEGVYDNAPEPPPKKVEFVL